MSCAEENRAQRDEERRRKEEHRREEVYRVYVTDALYALCAFVGIRLKGRYCELVRAERAEDTERTTGSASGDMERTDGSGGMKMAIERLGEMEIEVVR